MPGYEKPNNNVLRRAASLAAVSDCHVDDVRTHVLSNESREVDTFALGFRSNGLKKTCKNWLAYKVPLLRHKQMSHGRDSNSRPQSRATKGEGLYTSNCSNDDRSVKLPAETVSKSGTV
jgi:hypothetical protein